MNQVPHFLWLATFFWPPLYIFKLSSETQYIYYWDTGQCLLCLRVYLRLIIKHPEGNFFK